MVHSRHVGLSPLHFIFRVRHWSHAEATRSRGWGGSGSLRGRAAAGRSGLRGRAMSVISCRKRKRKEAGIPEVVWYTKHREGGRIYGHGYLIFFSFRGSKSTRVHIDLLRWGSRISMLARPALEDLDVHWDAVNSPANQRPTRGSSFAARIPLQRCVLCETEHEELSHCMSQSSIIVSGIACASCLPFAASALYPQWEAAQDGIWRRRMGWQFHTTN